MDGPLELPRFLEINWENLRTRESPARLLLRSVDVQKATSWYFWDKNGLLSLIGKRDVWFVHPLSQMSFERFHRRDLSEADFQAQRASFFLDTLVEKLVHASQSFALMARRMTGGNPLLINTLLGVSVEKSYSLAGENSLNLFMDPIENKKYVYTLLSTKGDWAGLKFSFYYYKGQVFPLHSWTGLREETFVFLHPTDFDTKCDLCPERIIRIIIHELAISADGKTEQPDFEVFQKTLVDKTNVCSIYNTLSNPEVRMAFSTMRAFRVEDRILAEVGFRNSRSPLAWHEDLLCSTQISQIISLNGPYKHLLTSSVATIDPPQNEDSCPTVPNKNLNLGKALKLLDKAVQSHVFGPV